MANKLSGAAPLSSLALSGGALLKPLSEGGGPASTWNGQSRRRQGAFRTCASVSPYAGFWPLLWVLRGL